MKLLHVWLIDIIKLYEFISSFVGSENWQYKPKQVSQQFNHHHRREWCREDNIGKVSDPSLVTRYQTLSWWSYFCGKRWEWSDLKEFSGYHTNSLLSERDWWTEFLCSWFYWVSSLLWSSFYPFQRVFQEKAV